MPHLSVLGAVPTTKQSQGYWQCAGCPCQVDGWSLGEDEQGCLRIRREWRTKNFLKALELCDRIGEVAESEGHHPDLHVTGM